MNIVGKRCRLVPEPLPESQILVCSIVDRRPGTWTTPAPPIYVWYYQISNWTIPFRIPLIISLTRDLYHTGSCFSAPPPLLNFFSFRKPCFLVNSPNDCQWLLDFFILLKSLLTVQRTSRLLILGVMSSPFGDSWIRRSINRNPNHDRCLLVWGTALWDVAKMGLQVP